MRGCTTFTGTFCLLPDEQHDSRACRVCDALAGWKKETNYTHVLVREADKGKTAVVFPACLRDMRPADLAGCILQISLEDDLQDMRETLNTTVLASERILLWQEGSETQSYIELKKPLPGKCDSGSG